MYYHIWFVTKYRKATLYGKTDKIVNNILTECISRHRYNVLEMETNKDHIHMLVEATDRKEVAGMVRILKAVSAKEILGTPHFRVGNRRHFWGRRYGCKEVEEKDVETIRKYILNQKNTTLENM
ncbi:MAG: IS200/IS605 family transposase [Candidatus Omnitrophica bacterium]|nr:IS200/IS605 family transposase [Candidatus Omnitrophota bacterium]